TASDETASDFQLTAPIYSAGSKLPYDVKINTGRAVPLTDVQVLFVVPNTFAPSLPPGAGIQAFVRLLETGGMEIIDHFDVCPSTFDPTAITVLATLPQEAFTDGRNADSSVEAIATLATI